MSFKNRCPAERMFSKGLMKHFKGFGTDLASFMQNLMQTHCSILPSIADKMTHEVEKALM
jgi:hypothetical protein